MAQSQPDPGSARVCTVTVTGIEGHLTWAQATQGAGSPGLLLTGLPGTINRETRDRVRAAILNSGQSWPPHTLTVTLQSTGLPRHGSSHDLAIAVAVLTAAGVVPAAPLQRCVFYSELGLDGSLRPVRGVVPALAAAARAGCTTAVVAAANAAEAMMLPGLDVIGCDSLHQVIAWLRHDPWPAEPPSPAPASTRPTVSPPPVTLATLGIPPAVRLGLEASAAGGHHLCLTGPPASLIPALAAGLAALLPPLTPAEQAEVTAIYSAAGLLGSGHPLIPGPPFRAPHYTTTPAGMAGGGTAPIPGEAALAHRGILFLDQAPEFARATLAVLREPLEHGEIAVARSGRLTRFPARFLLAAGLPKCQCGTAPGCGYTPVQKARYRSRLTSELGSHLTIWLDTTPGRTPGAPVGGQDPDALSAERVAAARVRAGGRLADTPWTFNAAIPAAHLHRGHQPEPGAFTPVSRAVDLGEISTRAADQILRVAWTLADLAGIDGPGPGECAQALAFYLGTAL